jgi:Flp pilus assembly protein TadG
MFNAISAMLSCLRRLTARREGNTAIIFGLAAIPVIVAAGMAVDVTRAYMVKMRLVSALDAAALAVGSEHNQSNATLQTDLQAYFFANFPYDPSNPNTVLGRNITVVAIGDPNSALSQQTVNYQAQATVDMSFMQLVGVPSITVTALAQTHQDIGLEVALVLDNTGSMLCGDQDLFSCGSGGVDPTDITCQNPANTSRICTLRVAAHDFLNIMTAAITDNSQLYVGVVPYVTTVNIANAFCDNHLVPNPNFNCSHMAQDACSKDFTDASNNIVAFPNGVMGNLQNGSTAVSSLSNNPGNTGDASKGLQIRAVHSDGSTMSGIPNGATISSTSGGSTPTSLTLSQSATTSGNVVLQVGFTATATAGSPVLTNIVPDLTASPPLWNNVPPIGEVLTDNANSTSTSIGYWTDGPAIPKNTAIKSISGNTITLCANAKTSGTVTIWTYDPVPYDPAANSTDPTKMNPATPSWMGCVVEPTSSDENSSVPGVINWTANVDPDQTEPVTSLQWYPFWWRSGDGGFDSGINNWVPKTNTGNSILAQTNANPGGEIQGQETTDWDAFKGPNQGCPVPILPLTDVTAANPTGKATVGATIDAMWPRDAGGTQVHVGLIWGWRVLSPTGPFTQNNGHPMTYGEQNQRAWKKAIVLMTDGQEEWPDTRQDTGLSYISDGKIGTTSSTGTAVSNLGQRLANTCANLAATNNYVIYTVGLGSAGATNTQLQNCATTFNGGFFTAATSTSQLDAAFQKIAKSLLALRLSK